MKKGFTLIEMLIALAIFSIVTIIIGSLYIYHSNLYRFESAAGGIKIQKTLFIRNFREIAEAASEVASSRTIGGVPYVSSSSTAVFKLPSIDANKNVISGAYDYAVFYKSGADIFLETDADPVSIRQDLKKKLSDSADSLIFLYDSETPSSASYVSASAHLSSGKFYSEEISSSAHLRNK